MGLKSGAPARREPGGDACAAFAEAVKAVKSANVTEEMDSEAVLKASLKYLAFL